MHLLYVKISGVNIANVYIYLYVYVYIYSMYFCCPSQGATFKIKVLQILRFEL